jgi:hypothetical protein
MRGLESLLAAAAAAAGVSAAAAAAAWDMHPSFVSLSMNPPGARSSHKGCLPARISQQNASCAEHQPIVL